MRFCFFAGQSPRFISRNNRENATLYELRQIINKEFISAASEESNLRVIYKYGNSIVKDISAADHIYIIT